jgi:hypothetical protein
MLRHQIAAFVCVCLVSTGCGRPAEPALPVKEGSDARVRALADAYLAAHFERFPEQGTLYGVPGRPHNALIDNARRR